MARAQPNEKQAEKPAEKPADRPSVIRETDDEARALARQLVRGARFASLAVLDPATGFPFASRILIATDHDGVPAILVSALSAHTTALKADPRASLLCGEPGKGDPLAHPRVTLQCRAARVAPESADRARLRERFLARHPKAKLYIDFPDFSFFRLIPVSASLNGGFGRAYLLEGEEFMIRGDLSESLAGEEMSAIGTVLADQPDAAERLARHLKAESGKDWRIAGLDAAGVDLAAGDQLLRYDFGTTLQSMGDILLNIRKI